MKFGEKDEIPGNFKNQKRVSNKPGIRSKRKNGQIGFKGNIKRIIQIKQKPLLTIPLKFFRI